MFFDFMWKNTKLFHFVLAVSIDKQLFYEHEFKFTNLKFCKFCNKFYFIQPESVV